VNTDRTVLLAVVVFLGLVTLTCVIVGAVVVLNDKNLPDALIAIGSSAGTALGLIATRPLGGTQDVNVVNQPVAVDDAGAVETGVCVVLCLAAFLLGWLAHANGLFV
jgi:hypothetical protein